MDSTVYRRVDRALQLAAMVALAWTLADVIVKLRKKQRWGRRRLSKEAKVSYATITRLETGKPMNEASIKRVADAFGLGLAELYGLVPKSPSVDALSIARDEAWARIPVEGRPVAVRNLQRQADAGAPAEGARPQSLAEQPETPATTVQKHRGTR